MPPRIIPVIDLKGGKAVHAVGGHRAEYEPLRSRLVRDADPTALALGYREHLGLNIVYLADLDAIAGASPDLAAYQSIRSLGIHLWVDAGIRDARQAALLKSTGISGVIVGLETLNGPEALAEIVANCGRAELIFSLDLHEGVPRVAPRSNWGTADPSTLARIARSGGMQNVLLLDLARVGTGSGFGTFALANGIARESPDVRILLGGGVSGPHDLGAAFEAGASAVLVGSALHDGRIGPRELAHLLR